MITLFTGLPGNGKTLFALWLINKKAEAENREVYYSGIQILDKETLARWHEFKAEEWVDLPNGCIIVIDEAQGVFPKKPNGAVLPKHYEQLAVHRHQGKDINLITQHPTLVDNFVRRLVGQHFHSVRKFGFQRATIYEWSAANPAPENVASQKSAISLKWKYPKEVYTWYKSAEVHTVKRQIPMKVVLTCAFILGVLGVGYYAFKHYQHRYDKPTGDPGQAPAAGSVAASSAVNTNTNTNTSTPKRPADPVEEVKDYLYKETPRIAGLQQTAPKYDPLTVPVRVPVPAMCVQVGSVSARSSSSAGVKCKCYSQQGTPMAVEFNMCIEFARNGFFQDFDADKDHAASARADAGRQVLDNRPDVKISTGQPVVPSTPAPSVQAVPVVFALANTSSVSSQRSNVPDKAPDDGQQPRQSRTVLGPQPKA